MNDEELKKKAEKATVKLILMMKNMIDEEMVGMTEEEEEKFMFYFLAAYGKMINLGTEMNKEEEIEYDIHDCIDAVTNARKLVYEEDYRPD